MFYDVENFNLNKEYSIYPNGNLESLNNEEILDITLDGMYTVTIVTDEWESAKLKGETVVKFNAKSVDVTEIN